MFEGTGGGEGGEGSGKEEIGVWDGGVVGWWGGGMGLLFSHQATHQQTRAYFTFG